MAHTVLGILGTTHDPDLRERYGYPLSRVEEAIVTFNPDIILGEVVPESWELLRLDLTYQADNFVEPPSEYFELIFALCRNRQIAFLPIDWCELDIWYEFEPFVRLSPQDRPRLEEELNRRDLEIRRVGSQSPLPFNSPAYDRLVRAKYDWLASVDPESTLVQWTTRNHIMAQRIRRAVDANPGKRLLTVVGADHNYVLAALLADGRYQLQYPLSS